MFSFYRAVILSGVILSTFSFADIQPVVGYEMLRSACSQGGANCGSFLLSVRTNCPSCNFGLTNLNTSNQGCFGEIVGSYNPGQAQIFNFQPFLQTLFSPIAGSSNCSPPPWYASAYPGQQPACSTLAPISLQFAGQTSASFANVYMLGFGSGTCEIQVNP